MKIGIDIGGSHIGIGLVQNGEVVLKREKDFLPEERSNLKAIIENECINGIKEILNKAGLDLKDIEQIRNRKSSVQIKIM